MALDLSALAFKVDTSELDRAGKAIGELVVNVGKLDKASKDAARTEATLAKAAKDNAKANLDNAKAQQVNAKAVESTEKAQKSTAIEVARSTSIIERQKDILEFQTQGFSKGQSSILAYGKAAGLAAADLSELGKVLETQRKLMGSDPFDKSLSGIKSLQNQYTELKESVRQYATDSNLSAKQTRELARDKERLIEKMKVEGASFSEIRTAVRAHNTEYVSLAASYNKMTSAEDAVIKSRKDAVTATNYLTQADQKLSAALNVSNASLDKAGTDSLVRYESALRKSGVSQEVATQKLATYKSQLTQVAGLEEKRRAQHLSRALTPQVSDVVVSLWSGQSPMTVLLQQGAQINDLFQLSGVAAKDFAKTVRTAMASMLPAILTVAKGIGGVITSSFYDAGKGVTNFIGNVFGMNKVLQHTDDLLYLVGGRATEFSKILHTLGAVASATFGVTLFAIIAGIGALVVGLKQVIAENDNLAKTLALSGAQLGLSQNAAIQYAKSMELTGVSTGEAIKVISEMAKAGNLGKDSIQMITSAAIDMEAYAGVSIEDTVKAFGKFKDKPVEALIELAKQTGLVSEETINSVRAFQEQGEGLKASALAMETYAEVTRKQSSQIKEDYNGLSLFFKELGKSVGDYWDGIFKNLFRLPDQTEALEASLSILKDKLSNARATVDIAGPTFATARQKQEVSDLEARIRTISGQMSATVRVAGEKQREVDSNIANTRANEQAASLREKYATAQQKSLVEITKLRQQEAIWSKAGLLTDERKAIIAAGIAVEQEKSQKVNKSQKDSPKDPSENYFATLMREATNNTIKADTATQGLTKSELKLLEVQSDSRFEKLTADQKAQVVAKYNNAAATEKLAEAEKQRSKIEDDALEGALKTIDRNKEIEDSYDAAKEAALEYIDTLRLQAKRENEGVGKGTSYRSDLSGLNGIEDKFNTKQSSLAKSKGTKGDYWYEKELSLARSTYEQELAIYKKSIADKNAAQGDWTNGAKEALANYLSETENVAKATENLFTKAFKGMEDAMVSFVKTGKLDFASLADSIITDLIRIQVQKSVMPMLSGGFDSAVSWVGSLFSANGNAFDGSGQVQKFKNGGTFTNQIVDQPTPFKFAKGTGIMGEAGPEAIMPLSRGADGKLGVQSSGGNNVIVQVIESPGKGGQQTRTNENGTDVITVFVEQIKTSLAADIRKGSGAVPDAMSQTYGLNRVAGAY